MDPAVSVLESLPSGFRTAKRQARIRLFAETRSSRRLRESLTFIRMRVAQFAAIISLTARDEGSSSSDRLRRQAELGH